MLMMVLTWKATLPMVKRQLASREKRATRLQIRELWMGLRSFPRRQACITYHSEVQLKEVYGSSFESDTESMINDIAKFLKKEYKAVTGETLSLTPDGETEILVQNTSRVRTAARPADLLRLPSQGRKCHAHPRQHGQRQKVCRAGRFPARDYGTTPERRILSLAHFKKNKEVKIVRPVSTHTY